MPSIKKINHVAVVVDDMEKAKKWYATAFGLEPYWDEPYYVGFNIGGYELGLLLEESAGGEKAEGVVTYWGVNKIEKVYVRIEKE